MLAIKLSAAFSCLRSNSHLLLCNTTATQSDKTTCAATGMDTRLLLQTCAFCWHKPTQPLHKCFGQPRCAGPSHTASCVFCTLVPVPPCCGCCCALSCFPSNICRLALRLRLPAHGHVLLPVCGLAGSPAVPAAAAEVCSRAGHSVVS
jgi:hypothetical protein